MRKEAQIEECQNDELAMMENGSVISGKEAWEAFYTKVANGEKACIDLGYLFRGNQEQTYGDLWIVESADYPALFLKRLTYDGKTFLLEPLHKVDGAYVVMEVEDYDSPAAEYQYLMHYEGIPRMNNVKFTYYDKYVLTDDDTVSWEQLEYGMISSNFEDMIRFEEVFCEYTWK